MMNELSILDNLFNTACNPTFTSFASPSFVPDVDVLENKDNYTLSMDLPGLTQENVDISLKDNVLTVASVQNETHEVQENKENSKEENENKPVYLIRERARRQFKRSFKLPRDINAQEVSATFKNGVLEINIPRKPEEEAKKIQIQVA